jgi:hypothetical protein
VVVPRGLVVAVHDGRASSAEAAAGLCHAAATCRAGLTTGTAALTLWCLPWSIAAGFLSGLGRGLKAFPLLWLAWSCRFVVASIAAAQLSNDGHQPMAAVVVAMAAATYAQPALARWWAERSAATADHEVVGLGLGAQYARLLAMGGPGIGLERHIALTAAPDPQLRRALAEAGVSRR